LESLTARTEAGRWRVLACSAELGRAALEYVLQNDLADGSGPSGSSGGSQPAPRGGVIELGDLRAWLKIDRLRGRASLRHAARRLAGRSAPRLREFENGTWLASHGFEVPRPLAAGVLSRWGFPGTQFLCSDRQEGMHTLLEVLEKKDARSGRSELLSELAREVARMHRLGFIHHDLFARNLLVREARSGKRLIFLDAWRGGPPPQLRGPEYDLACFLLEGAQLLDGEEQRALLEEYLREARTADRERFLERTERLRRRLFSRLVAQPGRQRGRPLPPAHWNASELGL
jgi:hypothetical protein